MKKLHTIKMSKPPNTPTPPLLLIMLSFLLLLLSKFAGGFTQMASEQKTWCIANPSLNNSVLLANLDYACSRVNCSSIQQGSSCFYPNTFTHHASFAMNLYYQSLGRHPWDCDFANSSLISLTDPSFRSCTYQSGGALAANCTSNETWCVAKPSTSDEVLQANINFACNHVDCRAIQAGGSCFNPPTLLSHATYAMNLYFQNTGRRDSSCEFQGSGLLVSKNPSFGNCIHAHSQTFALNH